MSCARGAMDCIDEWVAHAVVDAGEKAKWVRCQAEWFDQEALRLGSKTARELAARWHRHHERELEEIRRARRVAGSWDAAKMWHVDPLQRLDLFAEFLPDAIDEQEVLRRTAEGLSRKAQLAGASKTMRRRASIARLHHQRQVQHVQRLREAIETDRRARGIFGRIMTPRG